MYYVNPMYLHSFVNLSSAWKQSWLTYLRIWKTNYFEMYIPCTQTCLKYEKQLNHALLFIRTTFHLGILEDKKNVVLSLIIHAGTAPLPTAISIPALFSLFLTNPLKFMFHHYSRKHPLWDFLKWRSALEEKIKKRQSLEFLISQN